MANMPGLMSLQSMFNMGLKKVMSNLRKKSKVATDNRNERCVPVAKEVLKIIAKHDPLLHDQQHFDKIAESYTPISEEIMQLMFDKDLLYTEVQYVWSLVLVAFEKSREFVTESVENSLDKIMDIQWGKAKKDVTLGDMDKVLRKEYIRVNGDEELKIKKTEEAPPEETPPEEDQTSKE